MSRQFVSLGLAFACALACACDDGGSAAIDAGLDAQRRLALTIEGPAAVQATRSVRVEITANDLTRSDAFAISGLPATVDVPAPIQLTTWEIVVDGFDANGQPIGRGSRDVASGTAETTVTLAPL